MSQIVTLYSDKEKTNALYPRTKVSGISDENNTSLQELLKPIDNLTSSDTDKALSANQGKVLNTEIQDLNEKLAESTFKTNDGESTIDGDGGSIRGIKLYGKSYQKSYSGKNLLN